MAPPSASVRVAPSPASAGADHAAAHTDHTSTPSREAPVATVRGSQPGASATLLSLRRTGLKVVTARLQLSVDEEARDAWLPNLEGAEGDFFTAEGLVDEFNGREHFPLVDDEGECVCSQDIDEIGPGDSIVVSAKFPAPPANVTHASPHVPGFSSFDAVPLA